MLNILGLNIRLASTTKRVIEFHTKQAENGIQVDSNIYYVIIGAYEARIFGLCFFRNKTSGFIDKATDRFEASKNKQSTI